MRRRVMSALVKKQHRRGHEAPDGGDRTKARDNVGESSTSKAESGDNVKGKENADESVKLPQKVRANSEEGSEGTSGKLAEEVRAISVSEKPGENISIAERKPLKKKEQCAEKDKRFGKLEEEGTEKKDRVGDKVQFGGTEHIIIDIFQNEILELGDRVDWNFKNFNNFEAVEGDAPRDHHFYVCCNYLCGGSSDIERDWRVLERQFSEKFEDKRARFFIRVYKGRKNLMRVAVAISDREIPFCHGLFFFDVNFPLDYPSRPPEFSYRSYGRALGPDLPKTGTISFRSKGYGVSDVLMHIQEIVLNPRVYPNGMNNKQKFVWSCQTMLDMLKRPPTGFEDFVKGHFRWNAAVILRTFLDVMDMEDETNKNVFFKMYIAFEENNSYCEHLLNNALRQELKRHQEKESSGRKSSKAESLWSRIFS